jgi:hypothetical protein
MRTNSTDYLHADGFNDLKQIVEKDLESAKKLQTNKQSVKDLIRDYKILIKRLRHSNF